MRYKVMGGHWGEGYLPGDIIQIDLEAAKVRLELGELVEVKGKEEKKAVKEEAKEEVKEEEVQSAAAPEMVSEDVTDVTEETEMKPKRGRPKSSK